jgi:hypothetical protein
MLAEISLPAREIAFCCCTTIQIVMKNRIQYTCVTLYMFYLLLLFFLGCEKKKDDTITPPANQHLVESKQKTELSQDSISAMMRLLQVSFLPEKVKLITIRGGDHGSSVSEFLKGTISFFAETK